MLLITRFLFFILLNTTQISKYEVWQITEILDCNKFSACNAFGECYDFKLIGIKCIEEYSGSDYFNPLQTVLLEYDLKRQNQNSRKLVYAYTHDEKQINKELLRHGFASIHTVIPNIRYAHQYYDLQKSLQKNHPK